VARLLIPLILLLSAPAGAGARGLSLREAVALAVKQNPALAAAGAEVMGAEAGVEAARGLDDFVLEGEAVWRQTRRELVAGSPVQEPGVDEAHGFVSLARPLPTGGRLALTLGGDYGLTRFATAIGTMMLARSTAQTYTPSLQLSLEHPLLRGFGVAVARAERGRSRARLDLAGAQREGLAAALVRDVVAGYWDLAFATRELEIRRLAAAAAREQLARVQANINVGKQPRSASAEIEVAIALRDDAVLQAEQAVTERALELARLCGLSPGERVAASETPAPQGGLPPDPLSRALADNPQLQAVRAEERGAAVEIDVTENGLLPQLDFVLSGGPIGNAHDLAGAGDQLTGGKSYTVMAGLRFSQPIGRHTARGARDAAQAGLRKARLLEADIAGQVAAAVARRSAEVETAARRAAVLAPSTEAAALDLESEKARFEVGRATNFDVLRRQDTLAEVQLVLLRARVDHLKALAALDALTGDIFDRNGVRIWDGESHK
jgi:outer membrane protein